MVCAGLGLCGLKRLPPGHRLRTGVPIPEDCPDATLGRGDGRLRIGEMDQWWRRIPSHRRGTGDK